MLFDYEVVLTETVTAWPPPAAANNYLCIKQNSLMHGLETVSYTFSHYYMDSLVGV